MDLQLRGKAVVVTGAGSGIGRASAVVLSQEGCRLALGSRGSSDLEETARRCRAAGGEVVEIAADLTTIAGIDSLARAARARSGAIYGLVCCVGSTPLGPFDELEDDTWVEAFHMKFLATVRAVRCLLPDLRSSRGRVVILAGNAAHLPDRNNSTSGAMNAALGNLVGSLARRFAPEGVGFNCVNPGPVRTRRLEALLAGAASRDGIDAAAAEARIAGGTPDGRVAEPEEVAALVAYLLSPLSAHINGFNIAMDGGSSWAL